MLKDGHVGASVERDAILFEKTSFNAMTQSSSSECKFPLILLKCWKKVETAVDLP